MYRAGCRSSRPLVSLKCRRILLILGALIPGCQPAAMTPAASAAKPAAKPAGPSKVSGAVNETDLAKVELT